MLKNKQLYKENNFNLPKLSLITYEPFKNHKNNEEKDNNQKYISILNKQIAQIKPTHAVVYNPEFQIIIGGQNMYPLLIDVNNDHLIICSQEFFIVINFSIDQSLNSIQENTQSFLKSNVKLGHYNKVVLNEAPTSLKSQGNHIYFGLINGKILCYDIWRKNLTGTSDDFTLPIMQIQIISQNKIIAIDCAGNIKLIQFSHKTFLDKIIKTSVNTKDISVIYKNNKRQKIKKIFKNFMTKKQKQQITYNANNDNQVQKLTLSDPADQIPYFYTRLSIPNKSIQQLLIPDRNLIAVERRNKLSILSFNQDFQEVQEQTIMEIQKDNIGMLQFGVGGFQNSNNTHLLLVFSVKNKIYYYKGVQVEDNYEWLFISSTLFDSNIIDGKFISNNLLIVLTEASLFVCNVNQGPQWIHQFSFQKFSYIDFFVQQQGLNFDKNLVKKNILRTFNQKGEFFCLQGKRLLTGKIDSWKDYLQRYVDEQKFNEAITMSLKIYNRQLRNLCKINQKQQIRNQQMKQFFQKITLTYISYQVKRQNFNKDQMLLFCIYFLVNTESFQYLFTTIFQIVKSLNLEELFLQKLQIYIERGMIKYMPEQMFQLLINWYKKNQTKNKIQNLIQNFDLTLMDKSILLIICLKQHLYKSMIHICNQHNDFISPILKLCGIVFTQKLTSQQTIRIKQILFFYIKECLLGHNTQYGNDKAYIQMLVQIINFLFIPSTLDMMIGISCSDSIKVINMFFQTKILQYILENQGQFFIKKNQYIQLKMFQDTCINQFRVYQKMLATLIFITHQYEQINQEKQKNIQLSLNLKLNLKYEVNKFLSYLILKNQFPFVTKYKIQCILFYIKNPQISFSDDQIFSNQEQHQIRINAYFMRLMDSLMRSLESKDQQRQKTLNLILTHLFQSEYQKLFTQGKCYIYHQKGNFSKTIGMYLQTSNLKIKNKIFDYFSFNINEYVEISQEFIKNLDQLVSLNIENTLKILYSLRFQNINIEDIIINLSQYPDVQLQFIEKVLNSQLKINETLRFQVSQSKKRKISLIHLQIVVKHKISQLDHYIQKIDYPLEQAFKICQEKGSKTGKAYILIKSGRNMEGLMMLCDIFLRTCDEVFGNLARKRPLQNSIRQNLNHQLIQLLQTCHQQFTIDKERGEKIWQRCIKKIFKHLRICQNIKNQDIPVAIKQILHQIVEKSLKKMFSQLNSDFFINKFCTDFPNLPFKVFIIAFGQLFDRMEFYNNLQFHEIQLLKTDDMCLELNILKQSLKGHPVRSQCQTCNENISQSSQKSWKINSYLCAHSFHKMCLTNDRSNGKKHILKQGICSKCMNDIESYAEFHNLTVEYYHLEQPKEEQIKKKITKLKEYQQNQALIFDLPTLYT